MSTVNETISFSDAEYTKPLTAGNRIAILQEAESTPNKQGDGWNLVLSFSLPDTDVERPGGFAPTLYLPWPKAGDREQKLRDGRTMFGSKVARIKEAMKAFGGPETGDFTIEDVVKRFKRNVGKKCVLVLVPDKSSETGDVTIKYEGGVLPA